MAVVAMGHPADEGIAVGQLGELGEQLADPDAFHVGLDRAVEGAGVGSTGVRLGIESVEVAGAAPEPDLDDGAGSAAGGDRCGGLDLDRFQEQGPGGAVDGASKRLAATDRNPTEGTQEVLLLPDGRRRSG